MERRVEDCWVFIFDYVILNFHEEGKIGEDMRAAGSANLKRLLSSWFYEFFFSFFYRGLVMLIGVKVELGGQDKTVVALLEVLLRCHERCYHG